MRQIERKDKREKKKTFGNVVGKTVKRIDSVVVVVVVVDGRGVL